MSHPITVVSMDAQNYYDYIAHSPGTLAIEHLRVLALVTTSMFSTIQLMKFFLWTGCGNPPIFVEEALPPPHSRE